MTTLYHWLTVEAAVTKLVMELFRHKIAELSAAIQSLQGTESTVDFPIFIIFSGSSLWNLFPQQVLFLLSLLARIKRKKAIALGT